MIFLILTFAVSAFMIGFICGFKNKKPLVNVKPKYDDELLTLQKEYENFLNYDGTEQ